MNRQCTRTAPYDDAQRCPYVVVRQLPVCQFHLEQEEREALAAEQERRDQNRQHRAELTLSTRRIVAALQASIPEAERRDAIRDAEAKEARKDAWRARRRAQEAERRERAAEARRAAQGAAQDPETRQECRDCGRHLPLKAFHRDRAALLGRTTRCRECAADYDRARRRRLT